MIHSMTGFGDAHASRGASRYSVELKSLNNRYFKPTVRLPDEVAGLEPEIESLLRKRVGRGSILLTLKMKADAGAAGHTINTDVLQSYATQIRGAGFTLDDIDRLLWLPGVVVDPAEAASSEERLAEHREIILKLVGEAIDNLIATRRQEGEALLQDLLVHTARIREHLAAIAERAGGCVRHRADLGQRKVDALQRAVGRGQAK
ncbi:MAG: YicC/YloC family endoribonuclease, partial [Planctomycetota bacterium]